MDPFATVCSELAGGFSEADSPCVVTITSIETGAVQHVQVQSREPLGQPTDLLERLSGVIARETTDIQVGIYVLTGGLDGSKL